MSHIALVCLYSDHEHTDRADLLERGVPVQGSGELNDDHGTTWADSSAVVPTQAGNE